MYFFPIQTIENESFSLENRWFGTLFNSLAYAKRVKIFSSTWIYPFATLQSLKFYWKNDIWQKNFTFKKLIMVNKCTWLTSERTSCVSDLITYFGWQTCEFSEKENLNKINLKSISNSVHCIVPSKSSSKMKIETNAKRFRYCFALNFHLFKTKLFIKHISVFCCCLLWRSKV